MVSKLLSIDIKLFNEDKCIILLYSFSDSWDNLLVAIGSNETTLNFDDVVASLLSKETRRKTMDSQSTNSLSVRGHPRYRNNNKYSSGRYKFIGRYKYPGKYFKKYWKCGKVGHYKKDCRYTNVDKGKGSDDFPYI
jgi:hypothetical protein